MKRIVIAKDAVIVLSLDEFESMRAELKRLDAELTRLLAMPQFTADANGRVVRVSHSCGLKSSDSNAASSDPSDE